MTEPQVASIDLKSGLLLLTLATVWAGSFFFAEIALRGGAAVHHCSASRALGSPPCWQ